MIRRGVLLALAASAAAPVWAQPSSPLGAEAQGCRDDAGVDRCAPGQQAKVRALFGGAEPIEALHAKQVVAYRAFFVDGYGRDMPMVSFERWPGEDPEVIVRPAGGKDAPGAEPIRAGLSAKVWETVVREAQHFDRDLAPLPSSTDGPPVLCLHSWVATVEAAEAVGRSGAVAPRRKTQSACGSGLAITYAFKLAAMAREAIPACAVLAMDHQRNEVTVLEACTRLHGDRIAAAEVQNAFARALFVPQAESERAPPFSINTRVRLTWAGERAEGSRAARALWRARVAESGNLSLAAQRYEGQTAGRVRVSGEASRAIGGRRQAAAFEQTWIWDPHLGDWVLEDWTIARFKP